MATLRVLSRNAERIMGIKSLTLAPDSSKNVKVPYLEEYGEMNLMCRRRYASEGTAKRGNPCESMSTMVALGKGCISKSA